MVWRGVVAADVRVFVPFLLKGFCMETDLARLFQLYTEKAFSNPNVLSADGRSALERAFYAGAWSVLTTLPTASPALAQQVADFAKQTDVCADLLRQQCAAFAAPLNGTPAPRVPEVHVPAPVPAEESPAPAVAPAPAATSDSPNSDLPLSDGPQLE